MVTGKRIDDLIDAGWYVLETNFDEKAFCAWRKRCRDCLSVLLGKDHVYTRSFEDFVQRAEKRNLLTGEGILMAVREQTALVKTN